MSVLVTIRVTPAEARQILAYCDDRDQGEGAGWYYGSKRSFEKRHRSIKEVIKRALERAASTSTAGQE